MYILIEIYFQVILVIYTDDILQVILIICTNYLLTSRAIGGFYIPSSWYLQ